MEVKIFKFVIIVLAIVASICVGQIGGNQHMDVETYNSKWNSIQSWLNSTTGSMTSPNVKLLCTNRFIDLIVTMCRQFLVHESHTESITWDRDEIIPEKVNGVEENLFPKFRHFRHWNVSSLTATNKKLKSVLKKTLPVYDIQLCCSQSCNITSFIKYCPQEPKTNNHHHSRENRVIIGTISTIHSHHNSHNSQSSFRHPLQHANSFPSRENTNDDKNKQNMNNLRHNYELWKAGVVNNKAHLEEMDRNIVFLPRNKVASIRVSSSSAVLSSRENQKYDSTETVELNLQDNDEWEERSQENTTTTTATPSHQSSSSSSPSPVSPVKVQIPINNNQPTPEPYSFPMDSVDTYYRP